MSDGTKYEFISMPRYSAWKCYLYGSKGGIGLVYYPPEDCVPNFIVRWFMKICLGCTWVKIEEE